MHRLFAIFVLTFIFTTTDIGQAISENLYSASINFEVMGSTAHITVITRDQKTSDQALDLAQTVLQQTAALLDINTPGSPVLKINNTAYNNPVKIESDLFELLITARNYSIITNGIFDITRPSLVDLLQKGTTSGLTPPPEGISDTKIKAGYERILLDQGSRTIGFAVRGMEIDLQEIAPGFVVDMALEELIKSNALGGLVNLRGDTRCFGLTIKGEKSWKTYIKKPGDPDTVLFSLWIEEGAVAIRDDYNPSAAVHTPNSGQRQSNVIIVTNTAMKAAVMASATASLNPEEGIKLIKGIPGTEALILESSGKRTIKSYTDNIWDYIGDPDIDAVSSATPKFN
ncbi:MAG: FAD:protein FMN transferase, partial [Deltaproteobacteria bacterium]|nr:FAD:protein FMN transferase [Deltaproteobacteria bacterium]MBW1915540.1 FAD:protein FMN transferase [Deltaproteobacteria bacterium]